MSSYAKTGLGLLGVGALLLTGCSDDPYCYTCGQPREDAAAEASQDDTGVPEGGLDVITENKTDAAEAAAECPTGMGNCNGYTFDGCEANLNTDPLNCGACSQACALAHASTECKAGKCEVKACDQGWNDCDGDSSNGCESDTTTDPDNCGTCGNDCPKPAGATATCVGGVCTGYVCAKGFEDCDKDPSNGCEGSLLTDPVNCGSCGTLCAAVNNGNAGCLDGVCSVGQCDSGWDDCDKSYWSGCETELATDVNHCGLCANDCTKSGMAHAVPKCEGSQCLVGSCDPGFADCNGIPTDGCEVDLATDKGNCGACDNACPAIDHGQASCSMFLCGIASCDPGYQDCFGGATDGCETETLNDVDHCGSCTTVCPVVADGFRTCEQGVCKIGSCDADHEDCNGNINDGCEATLTDDPQNCGGCNTVCQAPANATAGCTGSTCGIGQCNAGFADCNNDLVDGCEFDITSSANNCGGCGVVCGSGQCQNGACVCTQKLLVIPDDSASGTQVLVAALGAMLPGWTIDTANKPSYQYDGISPALTSYGAVLVLAGGPDTTSYSTDMPQGGQDAIVNFVAASNGLILTEWAALHVAQGRWATLSSLVLLSRTVAYSGQVTYKLDTGFIGHPIWEGLPGSSADYKFTFASTSNVGVTKVANGVKRIVGSPEAIDAVAIRDLPAEGRVVHIAHAGNYSPNGWTKENIQRVVANSASWAARCK